MNWEELSYPSFNLTKLEASITADEVKRAVTDMLRKMHQPRMAL
jgi:hypothetical protein